MRLIKRRKDRDKAEPSVKLVAVVDPSLEASTPTEQMCADLYRRLYHRLCAVAGFSLGRDAARDIVHDVVLEFWHKWDQLTPEQRSDEVVVTAVRRRTIDAMRRDGRLVELTKQMANSGEVPTIGPFEPGAEVNLADIVDRIIAQLPPHCLEAYQLVHDREFTYKEAADALGLQLEGVKSRLRRANLLIREALLDGGYQVSAGEQQKALPSAPKSLPSSSEASHD